MKFSTKYFFSKCDQIHRKQWIWSHLLKKSLMENFIFCAVLDFDLILMLGHQSATQKHQHGCFILKLKRCFRLQLYQKRYSSTGVSWWILRNFLACNFIKNETPAQVFPWDIWKMLKKTYFVDHLWTAVSNAWFFYNFYYSLKWNNIKVKYMYPFNVFSESKDNSCITTILTVSDTNPCLYLKKVDFLKKEKRLLHIPSYYLLCLRKYLKNQNKNKILTIRKD